MLEKLNIQLKTPIPPGSQSTNSEPKTPYNLKQLQKQASTIKKLLRQYIKSPSNPIKAALGQLIKECKITINSGVFLAKGNQDLQATQEKQIQKKKCSNKQITA